MHLKMFAIWSPLCSSLSVNTLRPKQICRHFADDIFKCISLNENAWISFKISLKYVPKVRVNNTPPLVQIMAWRRLGDKPLSEPMMVRLLYWRIYVSLGLNELNNNDMITSIYGLITGLDSIIINVNDMTDICLRTCMNMFITGYSDQTYVIINAIKLFNDYTNGRGYHINIPNHETNDLVKFE